MLQLEAEIIDHRQCAEARHVACGAEIAVDVVLADPGVLDGAACALGMELRDGLVGREPRRMLVDPDNIRFSLDTHRVSGLPAERKRWDTVRRVRSIPDCADIAMRRRASA